MCLNTLFKAQAAQLKRSQTVGGKAQEEIVFTALPHRSVAAKVKQMLKPLSYRAPRLRINTGNNLGLRYKSKHHAIFWIISAVSAKRYENDKKRKGGKMTYLIFITRNADCDTMSKNSRRDSKRSLQLRPSGALQLSLRLSTKCSSRLF